MKTEQCKKYEPVNWVDAFKSAAEVPGGHVDAAIGAAYKQGLILSNDTSGQGFAAEMGRVYSLAYIAETGGEKLPSQIDFKNASADVGLTAERALQVARLMTQTGFLKREPNVKAHIRF
ncbi:MAG: hypothetical protein KA035_00620 [Candidatus Levybacteria bacterium]|nr:hypothetical protein [Candidatus Levybacteria bacterium]